MMNRNIIVYLFIFLGSLCSLQAQTVREIEVAQDQSYTDHVSLKQDAKDMDMIVKFVFNEEENALVVSLISYRNLFVFHDNLRYKQAIKCKKIRPDRFTYVVESAEGMKYKTTKEFRKLIDGSKKKHVFKQWLTYEGLQPQPTDYKMINDYIEQKFDIVNKDTLVTITLQDVLVMEPSPSKKKRYYFVHYAQLNNKYQIRIKRNPCLGNEEAIQSAEVMVENIKSNYETLKERYLVPEKISEETYLLLEEMRGVLMEQFPRKNEISRCSSLNHHWEVYNSYVDSIKQLEEYKIVFEKEQVKFEVAPEYILT
ncbi:MAG: hypothetical protein Q4A54_08595, partial [Parabacteroides sp.]|nr:hypothetical protein [Parabacteroides sp.]